MKAFLTDPFAPRRAAARATLCLCLLGIAACDNSEMEVAEPVNLGDPTPEQLIELEENTTFRSAFGTPRADGTFSASLATIFKGGFRDADGNGYAVELGREETHFSALAGLLPGSSAGDLPTQGIAAMHGVYQVAEVGKSQGEMREYGEVVTTSGRITLRADFEYGTLSGSDGTLTVDGSFSNETLTGSVYFDTLQAALTGKVGDERAIGVFHGTDSASAIAGGFLVER